MADIDHNENCYCVKSSCNCPVKHKACQACKIDKLQSSRFEDGTEYERVFKYSPEENAAANFEMAKMNSNMLGAVTTGQIYKLKSIPIISERYSVR